MGSEMCIRDRDFNSVGPRARDTVGNSSTVCFENHTTRVRTQHTRTHRRASGKKEKAGAGTDADTDTGRVGTPTDILGDLFQFDGNLVLFKSSYDVYLFVVAPDRENELMIHHFLQSLYDLSLIHI